MSSIHSILPWSTQVEDLPSLQQILSLTGKAPSELPAPNSEAILHGLRERQVKDWQGSLQGWQTAGSGVN